jgi:anti-anti-sigma factor
MRRRRQLRLLRGGAEGGGGEESRGWIEHGGGEHVVVALRGEWDASNCDRVRQLLTTVTGRHELVVLDLSQVTFADSTILALAVAAQAAQRAAGGSLRLVVAGEPVRVLLDSTGLRHALAVYPSRTAALRRPA